MEYRTQIISPPPTSAVTFFERLNEAGVRYGIFKSSRNTLMALAGDQDLDILVAREDYHRFCAIASDYAGIRCVNHRSLVSLAREDWFIPDFGRAKYLHLDVHTSVRLGGKFNKRYPCYAYGHIRHWDAVTFGGCSIPIVSPMDEAAITLSRVAFRSRRPIFASWQKLAGDWTQEIDELLFQGAEACSEGLVKECIVLKVQCQVKKRGNEIWVRREDMAEIRRRVRDYCGAPVYAALMDAVANSLATWAYAASRIANRLIPGHTIDRRRPVSGGLIIAVVAPDGMGKSTQVAQMWRLFSWKFSCTKLYLGTGDGRGWWLRRWIRSVYVSRRSRIRATLLNDAVFAGPSANLKSRIGIFLLSLWGVLAALERHGRVRTARLTADRGFIVFCDRWPQSIQPGIMDGPTQQRTAEVPTLLRRWELALYDRMSRVQPDITIHLIGDYAVSEARKPGELTRDEFDKRIALMEQMRCEAPRTYVIDAAGTVDEVSKSAFGLIWNAL
jgi:hypothetical protein